MFSMHSLELLLCPRLVLPLVITYDFVWASEKTELRCAMSTHINHLYFIIGKIKLIFLLKILTFSNIHHLPINVGYILDFSLSLYYFPLHPICFYPGHYTYLVLFTFFLTLLFSQLTALVHILFISNWPVKIRPTCLLPQPSPCQILGMYRNSSRSVVFQCSFFYFSPVTKGILKNYSYFLLCF